MARQHDCVAGWSPTRLVTTWIKTMSWWRWIFRLPLLGSGRLLCAFGRLSRARFPVASVCPRTCTGGRRPAATCNKPLPPFQVACDIGMEPFGKFSADRRVPPWSAAQACLHVTSGTSPVSYQEIPNFLERCCIQYMWSTRGRRVLRTTLR